MKKKRLVKRKIFSFFFFLTITISLFAFLGNFIYYTWFGSQAEKLIRKDEPFGIFLVGQNSHQPKQSRVTFVCVLIVNSELSRLGFVSFFPQTRINQKTPTIEQLILSEDGISEAQRLVSQIISLEIPFFVNFTVDDISRTVDLLEGLPYFILKPDILEGENLPEGEFFLDGSMVPKLLNIHSKADYASVFQLYRHYSLILNSWGRRKEKWEILKQMPIFNRTVQKLKTNLSTKGLYALAELFLSNENWLPVFLEMPLKKEKSSFILNKEAAALYYRDFNTTLTQEKTPNLEKPPSIEVRNGTTIPNLAKNIRAKLSRKGFRVLEFTNANRQNYEESILLDISGKAFYLQSVAKTLKIKKYYHAVNRTQFTDLILILGKDLAGRDF